MSLEFTFTDNYHLDTIIFILLFTKKNIYDNPRIDDRSIGHQMVTITLYIEKKTTKKNKKIKNRQREKEKDEN
jgi:hypothetical protein